MTQIAFFISNCNNHISVACIVEALRYHWESGAPFTLEQFYYMVKKHVTTNGKPEAIASFVHGKQSAFLKICETCVDKESLLNPQDIYLTTHPN
jgi:hypothetical protein